MSDNLYSSNIQGDFNDPTPDGSGYGSLPAAEKNQTYFAYFNGVGGTGPEIIDQTAYFIKYLIDAQGNVVTPQANSFALLNLNQNFEAGKIVNVTSLYGTTLFTSLLGDKTITDIGKIDTILTTETGSGRYDYITTMSFSQGGTSLQTTPIPDYTFTAKKNTSTTVTSTTWVDLDYNYEVSDPSGSYNNSTYTYTFSSNTNDYGVSVIFRASVLLNGLSNSERIYLQIVKSNDNFATSQSLDIICKPAPVNIANNVNYPPTQTILDEGKTYMAQGGNANSGYFNYIETTPQIFENGTKVKVKYRLESNNGTPSLLILGSSTSINNTLFSSITNYINPFDIVAPYIVPANYPTSSNATQSLLTKPQLSNILNPQSTFSQVINSSSLNFGFNNITSLSHIRPGDYIRFEYDKTKVSKIYNVKYYDILGITGIQLDINPPIPSGSIFDHFCIFRVIPNGNYIILDVPKPTGTSGQPLTGFIKPQYMSKELEDNFDNIIQKLAAEGTIS